ncbi:acylphosphatase [Microbacterium lacusdiani]
MHVIVHGRVQGIGYRYGLREQAQRLGLAGWVRNRHGDAVEAVLAGDAGAVEAALAWVEHGPEGAEVQSLETSGGAAFAVPEDGGFEIRRSA